MNKKIVEDLFNTIPKEKILQDEPMNLHTSFRIGGPAKIFIKATKIDEIVKTIQISNKNNIPLYIIGNGSNILVKDEGINGIVLKPQLTKIEIEQHAKNNNTEKIRVSAECGVTMGYLSNKLMQEGITGFEELSGIPGTIGGAIKMNAGAHGKEIKDIVIDTTFINLKGDIKTITNKEHKFGYRKSIFSEEKYIILKTTLQLLTGNTETIKQKMEEYKKWRLENQPLNYPNAGSTFKRGENFITAKIIDECGLKGYQIGGAQVSTKHAGFIVNTGNATAKDVIELVDYIKQRVYEKTGKCIELEIETI